MKMQKRSAILVTLAALAVLMRCNSSQNTFVSKPLRADGSSDSELLEAKIAVVHLNDSLSKVYVQIGTGNLLYRRADTGATFFARVHLRALLYNEGSTKRILDSAAIFFNDASELESGTSKKIVQEFVLKTPKQKFDVVLELFDLNRHVRYFKTIKINHSNAVNAQNFIAYKNDSIAFASYFTKTEEVKIAVPSNNVGSVSVDYYRYDFGPALPPFSTKEADAVVVKPDTTIEVPLSKGYCTVVMPKLGACVVKQNKNADEGLCLFVVDEGFPGLTTNLEMIQCTRYIMSKEEFDACMTAPDKKAAIDNFWLDIGGSKERSRELLKRYYGRVKEANKVYSSYMPGWKTDRGMIYIVLGPPFSIFRDKGSEVWVYGNEANPNSLRFVFKKPEKALSENDVVLERSIFYRESYHSAVEFWRQGVVFNDVKR